MTSFLSAEPLDPALSSATRGPQDKAVINDNETTKPGLKPLSHKSLHLRNWEITAMAVCLWPLSLGTRRLQVMVMKQEVAGNLGSPS